MLDVIDSLWTDSIHKKKFHVRTRQKFIIFGVFFSLDVEFQQRGKTKNKTKFFKFYAIFLVFSFLLYTSTHEREFEKHIPSRFVRDMLRAYFIYFKKIQNLYHIDCFLLYLSLLQKKRETSFTGRKPLNY